MNNWKQSLSFTDVWAWQRAHLFTVEVYKVTRDFPENERFGLISQFRRAAVSVPANIAEGYKKVSLADKLRFYNIAQGSLEECRYYIILSKDICYIDETTYVRLMEIIENASKYLNSYIKGVKEMNHPKDSL